MTGSRTLPPRDRQAWLRAVLENVPEGIITFDADGCIQSINPAALAVFACSEEQALGKSIDGLLGRPWAELVGRGLIEATGRRGSLAFPMELTVSAMKVAGQQGYVLAVRDVSERRSLEQRLQLAQRMESIALLAGGIAHDFNNILTGIITYAVLGKRRLAPGEPLYEELTEIEQQGQRAAALVKQLLAFSRPQKLQPQLLQMADVLRDVQKFLQRALGEHIALSVETAPDVRPLFGDPAQLAQALMNLCVNARDAMPRGGKLRIAVTNCLLDAAFCAGRALPGDYVRLAVTDTGEGMSAETAARAFEPFFTTKQGGTGLGLAVAYGIVRDHGGFLDLDSSPGRGTTVSIFLPQSHAARRARPATGAAPQPLGGDEVVLLVEDEQGVRRAAVRILEEYGYSVLIAADGEDGLKQFRAHRDRIDLVILDAVLPKMGGQELYEAIRNERPDMKFLLVSGYSTSVFGRTTPDRRATYLRKPFNPEDLGRRVREALDS